MSEEVALSVVCELVLRALFVVIIFHFEGVLCLLEMEDIVVERSGLMVSVDRFLGHYDNQEYVAGSLRYGLPHLVACVRSGVDPGSLPAQALDLVLTRWYPEARVDVGDERECRMQTAMFIIHCFESFGHRYRPYIFSRPQFQDFMDYRREAFLDDNFDGLAYLPCRCVTCRRPLRPDNAWASCRRCWFRFLGDAWSQLESAHLGQDLLYRIWSFL
jgi:hypothetical protein